MEKILADLKVGERRVINTHDQIVAAVETGLIEKKDAIAITYIPQGSVRGARWHVYSPYFKTDTDPNAHYSDGGCKTFTVLGYGGKQAALTEALVWVGKHYAPYNWVGNRMRDYVPAQVNKKFPIPKPAIHALLPKEDTNATN